MNAISDKNRELIIEIGIKALSFIIGDINSVWKLGHKSQNEVEKFGDSQYGYLISDVIISDSLSRIASNQALAFGCLFNAGKRSPSETAQEADLRLARINYVKKYLNGLPITQLRNRGVRNALAHYDERFLRAIIEANGRPISRLERLGISHLNVVQFAGNAYQIRSNVYSYYDDTFYLLSEKLQLEPLQREILAIAKVLGLKLDGEPLVEKPNLLPFKADHA